MEKISPTSVAALCPQLFGLEIERERVEALVAELTGILSEIHKLRELDLFRVGLADEDLGPDGSS